MKLPTCLLFSASLLLAPALTRAAGGADATEASPGLAALQALLVGVCDQALATALPEDHRALVQAIRVRAAG